MSVNLYDVEILASGYLPNAKGTLYTATKLVIIKTITIVNEDGSNRAVNLYLNSTGTSRRITPKNMVLGPGYKGVDDDNHTLSAGDLIEGDADAVNQVSYIIEGAIKQ